MKRLNLMFGNGPDIQVIIVDQAPRFRTHRITNNNNYLFVEGPKSFYDEIRIMADIIQETSEESWDVVDYAFSLQSFGYFKQLVEAAR